ncbi:MAG: four helix bundle protein [Candidatus Omnitrophota bacterium]|nr:four helix bundle protein [Candidatus Omnitrophota bacterium]
MKVKDYKDLKIWQKGIEIADKIYTITDDFPKSELYGLTSQMRRAAVSVPSNIAEGFVRHYTKEYTQFLRLSLGSCAELETQLIISDKRKYVKNKKIEELIEDLNHEMRMLMSLVNSLSRDTSPESRGTNK